MPANELTIDKGFDVLALESGGTLILSGHPAGLPGCSPAQAVAQYAALGAKSLLSLVTQPELEKLGLTLLPDLCAEHDMNWLHGPIEDYQAPDARFDQWWAANRHALHDLLDQRQGIALHCWGGRGRTGTVAGLLLVERGLSPRRAMELVRQHRPGAIETTSQENYLLALA